MNKIEHSVETKYPEHEKFMIEQAKVLGLETPELNFTELNKMNSETEMTDEEKAEMAEVSEKLDKQVKQKRR